MTVSYQCSAVGGRRRRAVRANRAEAALSVAAQRIVGKDRAACAAARAAENRATSPPVQLTKRKLAASATLSNIFRESRVLPI